MSWPGVSRHLRISDVCWRTATRASSSRRAWSSAGAGVAIVAVVLGRSLTAGYLGLGAERLWDKLLQSLV